MKQQQCIIVDMCMYRNVSFCLQELYADLQDEGVLMILRLVELSMRAAAEADANAGSDASSSSSSSSPVHFGAVVGLFRPLVLCSIR